MIINEKGGNLVIIDLFVSELPFEKLLSTWHCGKCTGDKLYKIAPASKKLQEAEEEEHRIENVSLISRNGILWEHHGKETTSSKKKKQTNKQINKLNRNIRN